MCRCNPISPLPVCWICLGLKKPRRKRKKRKKGKKDVA
jgi:hypothetical protein